MIQTKEARPGAALDAVKARKLDKPAIGSRKKPEPDMNDRAKGARKVGNGEERLLQTYDVTCSCCGKPFELPFKPERTDRPLYGPCCEEKSGKGSF